MNNSGHIFRLEDKEAVIATKDLDFYKIRRRPDMLFLGQEVTFSKPEIIKIKNTRSNLFRFGAVASGIAAAVILLLFAIVQFNTVQNSKIYAYIDVDTNLSLRLAIDDKNIVHSVNPINEDTRILMKGLKLESKTVDAALAEIINKSKEKGYLNPNSNDHILISASLNSNNNEYKSSKEAEEQKLDSLLNNVNKNINKIDNLSHNTKVIKVDPEIKNLASKENVSMGRYAIYANTKQHSPHISIDEVRKSSLNDFLNKAENNTDQTTENKVLPTDNYKNYVITYDNNTPDNKSSRATPNNNNNNNYNNNYNNIISSPKPYIPPFYPKYDQNHFFTKPAPSFYVPAYINTPQVYNTSTPTPTFTEPIPFYIPTPVKPYNFNTMPVNSQTPSWGYFPRYTYEPFKTPIPSPVFTPTVIPSPSYTSSAITIVTNIPTHVISSTPAKALPTPAGKPSSPPVNNIIAYPASEINSFSAYLSGEVVSLQSNPNPYISNYVSIIYWESDCPYYRFPATSVMSQNFPVKISAFVQGLKPNTNYQYQVVVNNFFYSNVESFKTSDSPPPSPRNTPNPNPWNGWQYPYQYHPDNYNKQ